MTIVTTMIISSSSGSSSNAVVYLYDVQDKGRIKVIVVVLQTCPILMEMYGMFFLFNFIYKVCSMS